jgi:hypothetical protein
MWHILREGKEEERKRLSVGKLHVRNYLASLGVDRIVRVLVLEDIQWKSLD